MKLQEESIKELSKQKRQPRAKKKDGIFMKPRQNYEAKTN